MKRLKKAATSTDTSVFPTEAIFPGIHKLRPDIAARDAEAFLAYGHKLENAVDLDDAELRRGLLDCPLEHFQRFMVKPRPALQERLDALPEDWEEREECHPAALAITDLLDKLYDLPARGLCSILLDRELWVIQKR